MQLFDVRLVGFDSATGHKLVLTLAFAGAIAVVRYGFVWLVRVATGKHPNERVVFWTRQATSVVTVTLAVIAIASIWFERTSQFATAAGFIGAGLAFAMQKVVTAFAGYLVILRGQTFTVGDRITMGGVRGDVISLGFLQTRIMEMGEPPSTQSESDRAWVHARQYTGRLVTVTNDKVFDEPVYNFTREFPFIWEEIRIPISYHSDRRRAEAILLACAKEVVGSVADVSAPQKREMEKKYFIDIGALQPRVYYQLTDNWIEMNLRFITDPRGTRNVKDEVSRLVIDRFDEAQIGIASGTYEIVGFPPLRLEGPAADALVRLAGNGAEDQRQPARERRARA
jgi:small-conductance mechanosensitive channel